MEFSLVEGTSTPSLRAHTDKSEDVMCCIGASTHNVQHI